MKEEKLSSQEFWLKAKDLDHYIVKLLWKDQKPKAARLIARVLMSKAEKVDSSSVG